MDADDPDTGWFVYGVTVPSLRVPEGLLGVDDQPVRLLTADVSAGEEGQRGEGLAAIASLALLERPPGRRAELLAYTRVLDSLAEHGPVAPVRFGAILADAEDVAEQVLLPGAAELTALLAELADRIQFTVRAEYVEDAVLAEVVAADPHIAGLRELTRGAPEDAYYAERVELGRLVAAALDRAREHDTARILDAISPYATALSARAGRGMTGVVEAPVLADRARVAELEGTLESLAEEVHGRMRLQLVGPMAPYDFVGGGPWD